jgi:hypothetical protein
MTSMTKTARLMALMLVASCALASAAIAPAVAGAQPGSEDEYSLDLPGSGADENTPAAGPTSSDDSSGSGGFPTLVVILVVAAGVAAGIAAWRLRKPHPPDEHS